MSLADLMTRFEARPVSITIYSSSSEPVIVDWLESRHVDVGRRRIPVSADPFLVVRESGAFLASVPIETVRELLEPTISRPWDEAFVSATYRVLFDVLAGTVLSSLDRRQLLAVTREIEHRAWTVGAGTLHVGFQSLSAMTEQVPVYGRLATETDLEIHVYGTADRKLPIVPNVTVHVESAGEIGEYWFLAFDGGETDVEGEVCALLAEEVSPDVYQGFWTYERARVEALLAHLRGTYA